MKNKFLQHRSDAIGNIILALVLMLIILLPWIFGVNTMFSMAITIIVGPILIMGFMQGFRNQEFDIISFSEEGVTTRRLFTKASIKWENVSSVKLGDMLQPAMRGEKKVKKLIIHAKDEEDGSAIKLYMDNKEEILESIKYYKQLGEDKKTA
jgi:hypothetical protein